MFLNKNWKFYSPVGESHNPAPVEDNSLSKNYTDNVDAEKVFEPTTPIEKYIAKMNGDDVDIPTPTNGLEYQLKRKAENGQSSPTIPTPTSSDEGKVLTVNSSGDPAWATPSGGGLFLVEFTETGTAPDTYFVTETLISEINAASNNSVCIARMTNPNPNSIFYLTQRGEAPVFICPVYGQIYWDMRSNKWFFNQA